MDIIDTVAGVKARLRRIKRAGLRVGLVPTMGALHDGHLSLARLAKSKADIVIASVFVNPTQFGPNEDLDRYPRDLEGDASKLADAGCDLLFAPSVDEVYPAKFETAVELSRTTQGLCGAHRPGHFNGVTTVVMKLFGIVGPDVAVFGEKDFQQLTVLRRMVEDLCLDIDVVGAPLVREPDGLAMSSRNAYLSDEDRKRARSLSSGLQAASQLYDAGERQAAVVIAAARRVMDIAGVEPEYLEVRAYDDLTPLTTIEQPSVMLVAAPVGSTRLLDNRIFERPA